MIKGQYCLQINTAFLEYQDDEPVEIGRVVNTQTEDTAFCIVYDKNLYKNRGYHLCPIILENATLAIFVDDKDRDCLYNKQDVFLALATHEYGHYINGDLTRTDITNQQIREDRLRCIKAGKVQEMELNADAFAVSCVGKNTFLRALDYLIVDRKKRNDKAMPVAIKEFELRKKAVQKIK